MKSGIKSLFLFVFAHKKYSRRFINLRLSHCSHLDYINDVFNTFSGPASYNVYRSLWWSDPALRFDQKYLNLCSKDERRSYGVGTTWGWVITDRIFIFGLTNPLNKLNKHLPTMYFSSSTVGDAGSLVIDCQASQSEFSSLISDWLELWHIVTLGCVEQASRLRLESTQGWYERSKKVKLCTCEREHLRTSKYLF